MRQEGNFPPSLVMFKKIVVTGPPWRGVWHEAINGKLAGKPEQFSVVHEQLSLPPAQLLLPPSTISDKGPPRC